jgi:hypothetical protein
MTQLVAVIKIIHICNMENLLYRNISADINANETSWHDGGATTLYHTGVCRLQKIICLCCSCKELVKQFTVDRAFPQCPPYVLVN